MKQRDMEAEEYIAVLKSALADLRQQRALEEAVVAAALALDRLIRIHKGTSFTGGDPIKDARNVLREACESLERAGREANGVD